MNSLKEFLGLSALTSTEAGIARKSGLRPRRSMHALESRIVFDGAVATTVVDPNLAHATDAAPISVEAVPPTVVLPTPGTVRQEIVFIESNVADYQTLLDGVAPDAEVHVLDAAQDGLAQIQQILDGRSGIDAIHIVSHGSEGSLQLGSLNLTTQNLQDHAAELAAIGSALDTDADILLYGCDVAKGSDGEAFVTALAQATQADIAASTDSTGAVTKDGNWTLEKQTGQIDTDRTFADQALLAYDHLLVLPNGVQDITDTMANGSTSLTSFVSGFTFTNTSGIALLGDPTSGANGIYINETTVGVSRGFSISADGTNMATFDLTGMNFTNFFTQNFTMTITGHKSGGGTVSTTCTLVGATFTPGNYASFTGLTSFDVLIAPDAGNSSNIADITFDKFTVANAALPGPTVTDAKISISGATGTGGAYKIGDTVTATWNNTAGGDNNAGITGVTMNFSAFGGGAAVAATNSGGTWTATYTIVAGAIDGTNKNVSVSATDASTTTTTADTTNATLDNIAPTVSDGNISLSGASGTGGAFKIGDTVTATWNNTAGGDNNTDTISGVTVDFSAFGGSSAVTATNSGGTWTATYTIVSGAIDGTNKNISVTATDNAGNAKTTADTTNATLDNIAPTVSDGRINISGASGTGGAFKIGDTVTATWNNTAGGDNNADTISGVTVDFSAFGGGSAVAATNSGGTWTATYTIIAGAIDGTNKNISVSATDNAGNTTTTADTTNATVDNIAPSAPTGLDLATASDSGSSTSDNITSITTPVINGGGAEAGATVTLYDTDGTTALGTATADGSGNWSITSSTLSAGAHTLTTKQTDSVGNISAASSSLSITVDTAAPSAPSAPDMTTGTDTGSSSTDNLTNDTTPTFTGTAEANSTVKLYDTDGTTLIGTGNADGTGNWTITTSALSNGAHTVTAKATDAAGNTSVLSTGLTITIDTLAPTDIALSSTTTASSSGSTVGTLSATDATSGDTFTYSLVADAGTPANSADNGSFVIAGNTLQVGGGTITAGTYHVNVRVTDAGGNIYDKPFTITAIDIPAVSAITCDTAAVTKGMFGLDYTVTFNQTVDGVDASDFSVVKGAGVSGTAVVTITAGTDGSNTYTVHVAGLTGDGTVELELNNSSTGIVAHSNGTTAIAAGYTAGQLYTLDNTAPNAPTVSAISTDSGTADGITNDTTLTVSGTAEANSTVNVYRGGVLLGTTTASAGGAWTYDYTGVPLAEGTYAFTATATDAAGNVGAASSAFSVTVDTTAPASPSAPDMTSGTDLGISTIDNITSTTTPTFTGTAEANSTVNLYDTDGTTLIGTGTADGAGNWSITVSALSAGAHTITVKATDTAGNVSVASTGLAIAIDTSAPGAPSAPDMSVGSDSGSSGTDNITSTATPTFTGTAEANSIVNLYDTDGITLIGTTTADGAGAWSITASVLGAGAHTITAKATDTAGNTSLASAGLALTIDTSAAVPSAPDMSAGSDSGSSSTDNITSTTTPTLTGTAEANSTITLYDTDGTTLIGTGTTDGAGNWSITTSALGAGSHTLTAKQTDIAGNVSAASAGLAITIDTTAPVAPSAPDLTGDTDLGSSSTDNTTSDTTPSFSGTAENGSTVILYDTDGTTVLGTATATGGNWSITSSGLGDGVHTLTATATDAAGNVSAASVGLAIAIDTTAPVTTVATVTFSADTGISNSDFVTKTAAQTISGTLSGVTVAGEIVEVSLDNGTTWNTATNVIGQNTWSLSGQMLTGSDTLKVRVTDAAGNGGTALSQAYTLDQTVPAITFSGLSLSADTGTSNTDFITITAAQTISATLSSGLSAGDTVYGSLDNGATWTDITAQVSGTTLTWNGVTLTGSDTLKFKVTDSAGNDGTIKSQTYVLDTAAPTTTITTKSFSADTGASSTDFITNTAAQTISGTLSANLAAGETVEVSLDNGSTWTTATTSVGQNTWFLSGQTLAGSNTLQIRMADAAGNKGTAITQAYVLDMAAPTATFSGPKLSADTGVAGDFKTNTVAQTISATLSAPLDAGDTVWGSLDNGASWSDITNQVTGTSLVWNGVALASSNTLQLRVTDRAGNSGTVMSQAFVLEIVPPPQPQTAVTLPVMLPPLQASTTLTPATPPLSQALQDLPPPTTQPAISINVLPTPELPSGAIQQSGLSVDHGIDNFSVTPGQAFSFSIPKDAFLSGSANAQLSFQASLANGAPLPSWLRFNPETGTFSGVVPEGEKEELRIRVRAMDGKGNKVVTTFTIRTGVITRENAELPLKPLNPAPLSGKGLLSVLGITGFSLTPDNEQTEFTPEQQTNSAGDAATEMEDVQVDSHASQLSSQLQREAQRFALARQTTLHHLATVQQAAQLA